MAKEIVRALRVVEYIGTREFVDRQMVGSAWSERRVTDGVIKAGWIGIVPSTISPEEQAAEETIQRRERRRNAAMVFLDAVAKLNPKDNSVEVSDLIRWAKEVQTS